MTGRDEVRLFVPASPEFLHLARITASGLASRLGFSYDEVEDLRLALDELCFALIGSRARQGMIELLYSLDSGGVLEVEGMGHFELGDRVPSLSPLSQRILSALVDEFEVYRLDPDVPCFRLVKRRTSRIGS